MEEIEFSVRKIRTPKNARKLQATYTVELFQDLTSMWGDFEILSEAQEHKKDKIKWLDEYTLRIKKLKGIEKLNMQKKLDKLKYEVENHKTLFAEYYL